MCFACCEGCGKRFGVELDVASDFEGVPDFEHMVREAILDGNNTTYTWGG